MFKANSTVMNVVDIEKKPLCWKVLQSLTSFLAASEFELNIPLRFRKAGKVWYGGARETH